MSIRVWWQAVVDHPAAGITGTHGATIMVIYVAGRIQEWHTTPLFSIQY